MNPQLLRTTTLLLALALASSCATFAPATQGPIAEPRTLTGLADTAREMLDEGDWEGADAAWSSILADPGFDALPRPKMGQMLSDAGNAAMAVGDNERARELLLRAVSVAPADIDAWWRLALVALRQDDPDAAATALARIALTDPAIVDNMDAMLIAFVLGEADQQGLPRLDLLQALFDSGWSRQGLGVDYLWVDLALMHLGRGQAEQARAVVDTITDPLAITQLRMDKRFDHLVDRTDPRFDVATAMQRKLEHVRALSAANPRWLEARNFLGFALIEAGYAISALQDTQAILGKVAAAPLDTPPFDDMDQLSWVGNSRAIALVRLGRLDEAASAMRQASRLSEQDGQNVSQVLNLGSLLCGMGRWEEARAAISNVGQASGYGKMVKAHVEHCVALGLGEEAAAREALQYIRAHRDDAEAILLEALLAAGRIEEAAGVLIGQLESPQSRGDVLLALQGFRQQPPLPAYAAADAAWDTLLKRPDIRAAIDEVGRIEKVPIHSDSGF